MDLCNFPSVGVHVLNLINHNIIKVLIVKPSRRILRSVISAAAHRLNAHYHVHMIRFLLYRILMTTLRAALLFIKSDRRPSSIPRSSSPSS